MMRKETFFKLLTFSLFSVSTMTAHASFNNERLLLSCSHFAENKQSCAQEVLELNKRNTPNSIVNYCYGHYNTIDNFMNCLKYEYNPAVFLKYKVDRHIPQLKVMEMQKNIGNLCLKSSYSLDKQGQCFENGYVTLEKSKNKTYWIENYCVSTNESFEDVNKCVSKIKREALSENNLLSGLSNLVRSSNSLKNHYETKRSIYFQNIFKNCSSTFSNVNTYHCVDKKIKPVIDSFLMLDLQTLICAENNTFEEYKQCLIKYKK